MTYQQLEMPHEEIRPDHEWSPQPPAEEFRDGFEEGRNNVLDYINRAEFDALAAALDKGPAAFFLRLRDTHFLQDEPAAHGTQEEFNRLMFGPFGGGIYGPYAAGYMSAFENLRPITASTH